MNEDEVEEPVGDSMTQSEFNEKRSDNLKWTVDVTQCGWGPECR